MWFQNRCHQGHLRRLSAIGVLTVLVILGLSLASTASALTDEENAAVAKHWQEQQQKHEVLEDAMKKPYKSFDAPLNIFIGERIQLTEQAPSMLRSKRSVIICRNLNRFLLKEQQDNISNTP